MRATAARLTHSINLTFFGGIFSCMSVLVYGMFGRVQHEGMTRQPEADTSGGTGSSNMFLANCSRCASGHDWRTAWGQVAIQPQRPHRSAILRNAKHFGRKTLVAHPATPSSYARHNGAAYSEGSCARLHSMCSRANTPHLQRVCILEAAAVVGPRRRLAAGAVLAARTGNIYAGWLDIICC